MTSVFAEYYSRFLNIIYPKQCLSCGIDLPHDDQIFSCVTCWDTREIIGSLRCTICSRPLEYGGERCFDCKGKKLPYRAIYASVRYRGVIQKYLHLIKFNKRMYLIQPLTELMCKTIDEYKLYDSAEAIIPVPLHPARHRERGFNQSELMSTAIGKNFNIPVISTLLIRKKNTHPQFDLSKDQRIKNIHDAFSIHKQYAHHVPERVLLIDDICTTGETFHECTTVLKKAGVKEVTCLALARN